MFGYTKLDLFIIIACLIGLAICILVLRYAPDPIEDRSKRYIQPPNSKTKKHRKGVKK